VFIVVVVVLQMFEMLVLEHNLVDESSQPDAGVGCYQVHQSEPHPHFIRLHLQLRTATATYNVTVLAAAVAAANQERSQDCKFFFEGGDIVVIK